MSHHDPSRYGEHHPLLELLKQLYGARELIVDAYERTGAELDEKDLMRVEPLLKAHLIRREGSGGIRLNQKLQKVFDSALRKNRIAAINTDLHWEMQAAALAMQQLEEAKQRGLFGEIEPAREEVEQHLLAIYDILDDSSTAIYNRVTSSYGMMTNPEIRKREHELYNRQLSNLVDSYNQMRSGLTEEPFSLDHEIAGFIGNLDIRCMEVVDRIRQIQNTIRDNLFRVRELEKRARKIRAVADHLRQNPGFEATNTQERLEENSFFQSISPVRIQAAPDLQDPGVQESCAELVTQLSRQLKTTAPKTERNQSQLMSREQSAHVAKPAMLDMLVLKLLARCYAAGEPLSALEFWHACEKPGELANLHESEWLYGLALYMDSNPKALDGRDTSEHARLFIHAVAPHRLAGTHRLVDLFIYPTFMSRGQVEAFISSRETQCDHEAPA